MVMYDGSNPATTSRHTSGTANFTSPAPLRSVDIPDNEIAPAIPREPPMSSCATEVAFVTVGRSRRKSR